MRLGQVKVWCNVRVGYVSHQAGEKNTCMNAACRKLVNIAVLG